nr:hypothetical protein [Tanacetum cinerariifolium]
MSALVEFMILSGGDNHPPMLEKHLYDLWKSKMELYMQNIKHERMILESVEHGPLIWPTIEENDVSRTKKYEELSAIKKIQADYDLTATNIILQGLPTDVYSLIDHHRVNTKFLNNLPPEWTTNNQLRNSSNPRQQATIYGGRVTVQPVQGRQSSFAAGTSRTRTNISGIGRNNSVEAQGSRKVPNEEELDFLADPGVAEGLVTHTVITHNAAYQADDLDAYDSDSNNFSIAKAALMANLSSYGSDVLSKVPRSENTHNDMLNQSVPMLYDGSVISKETNVILIVDYEETLMLEEESRSKIILKQSDPMVLEKKVNIKPINYAELNRLSEDFGKRFIPQQELSDKQAFRLQTSHPNTDQYAFSRVKTEAPWELSKVSLVNTILKKLKYHLGQSDNMVKKHITLDALTEGEWGFEHTKPVFLKEIIPFLKTLNDLFNVFDKDLLNEVTEVQTVFNQREAAVQQYFVDKQCFEIQQKQLLIENDRVLDEIISQDIVNIVVNSSMDMNT